MVKMTIFKVNRSAYHNNHSNSKEVGLFFQQYWHVKA